VVAILQTSALSKTFGGLAALTDVDLSVNEGEIHCVIGPNGAGKSTLFKLIMGTYPPTAGAIAFRGENVTERRPYERVKRGLSIKMQTPSIFKELSVRRNIHTALQHHVAGAQLAQEEERLLAMLELSDDATKSAGALSHGQQQWLEIGMALAVKPAMMLMDEPTAGMSPDETFRTGELIKQLNASGMTVLVVEHDMTFVRQVAQHVTVMHFGKVFARGSMSDILADAGVAEIYLGKPRDR